MSLPLILGALWVVAAAITAMMPLYYQRFPGIPLLVAAPILLVWIGMTHGWLWTAFGVFAFLSMFRRPLNYLIRKALGLKLPDLPPELQPGYKPKGKP
jgi:Protein of unknown function (DUF2484)